MSPTSASTSCTCRRSTRSARTYRKGRDNTLTAGPDDPGSPWAIGSSEGGHDAVHPDLGTLADVDAFVARGGGARPRGRARLRPAVQPGPPLGARPSRVVHTSDPTARSATPRTRPRSTRTSTRSTSGRPQEADRVALWAACRDVLEHWIGHGIRTFRVDNPHTKPLAFWEWVIDDVHSRHPDVVFLAEAFTAAGDDGQAGRGRLHAELHVLHLAPRGVGAARVRRPSSRRARWPSTCARRSGPTRPTSSTTSRCATRRPPRSRCASSWPPRSCPLYGIYSGYELCENEPASDDEHGVPATPRSTRSRRATTTSRTRSPRCIRTVNDDPPPPPRRVVAARRALPPQRRRRSSSSTAAATSDTDLLLCVVLPRPAPRRTRRRCASTSAPSGLPDDRRYHAPRRADRRHLRVGRLPRATSASIPPAGQVAHLFHVDPLSPRRRVPAWTA